MPRGVEIFCRKENGVRWYVVRCKGCGSEWVFKPVDLVTDVIELLKSHHCERRCNDDE